MTLRIALVIVALAALGGAVAIDRPERFAVMMPAALLTVVFGAGAVAADAVPLRRVPLATSVVTLACGFALFVRAEVHVPLAAALVILQVIALVWTLRVRRD